MYSKSEPRRIWASSNRTALGRQKDKLARRRRCGLLSRKNHGGGETGSEVRDQTRGNPPGNSPPQPLPSLGHVFHTINGEENEHWLAIPIAQASANLTNTFHDESVPLEHSFCMRVLPLRWWRLALMTPVGFSSSLLTTPLTKPHESVPLSDLTQQLIRRAMP